MDSEWLNDMKRMADVLCRWDDERTCPNDYQCGECEWAPDINELEFGRSPETSILWREDDTGHIEPICPSCGENPGSVIRCLVCGQRFVDEDVPDELNGPEEVVAYDCPVCGAKKSLMGRNSKFNGHFTGHCISCGADVME